MYTVKLYLYLSVRSSCPLYAWVVPLSLVKVRSLGGARLNVLILRESATDTDTGIQWLNKGKWVFSVALALRCVYMHVSLKQCNMQSCSQNLRLRVTPVTPDVSPPYRSPSLVRTSRTWPLRRTTAFLYCTRFLTRGLRSILRFCAFSP